ncbi:hypothetical protein NOCA2220221 [metagenome]|uniref:Proteinase inhibitor I42 chagasin domain-containing protein n=1 Tax=metagenome TaxID=256318 RepID=A0A2P2BZ40_9ZZZZ
MRHVLSEPKPGSVVRLRAGDWLEVRLTHTEADADWQVVDQPGCLFPVAEAMTDRPSVLPPGPRRQSLGFLAFGAPGQPAQPLRLALVDRRRPGRGEVCEVSVLVS